MYESDEDLVRLQDLLDRSVARASEHLTSIVTAGRRCTTEQLGALLAGMSTTALSPVTAGRHPRPESAGLRQPRFRGALRARAAGPHAATGRHRDRSVRERLHHRLRTRRRLEAAERRNEGHALLLTGGPGDW